MEDQAKYQVTGPYVMLSEIQSKLKAPKSQFNDFGKYHYRNCEDILEALKPILHEYGAHVIIFDEVVFIGSRYYIKATVQLKHGEKVIDQAMAFARETEVKKGMDEAQVTGSASSYARKYALDGLFAIDDTKDADTTNKGNDAPKKEAPQPSSKPKSTTPEILSDPQRKRLFAVLKGKKLETEEIRDFTDWLVMQEDVDSMEIEGGKHRLTKRGVSFLFDSSDKVLLEKLDVFSKQFLKGPPDDNDIPF